MKNFTVIVAAFFFLWPLSTRAADFTVREISPNDPSLSDTTSITVGMAILFRMSDATHGSELWKYDSSNRSLSLIKDIAPGSTGSTPFNFIEYQGEVYFTANDGTHGNELWKTDGTEAGTQLVVDLYPGSDSGLSTSSFLWPVIYNNQIFFTGSDATHEGALFKSDGTPGGTSFVWDTTNPYGYPKFLYVVNSRLLFIINDGASLGEHHGEEWYQSDGTGAGTSLVKDICEGVWGGVRADSGNTPVIIGDVIYFQGYYAINDLTEGSGTELYRTDGTFDGTYMVKDINLDEYDNDSGTGGSGPYNFTVVDNTLFFTAYDGTSGGNGTALWKSDGTETGTVMVKDINPATDTSNPIGSLAAINGALFFRGDDGTHGDEVWSSDGTESGTVMLEDIVSGSGSSNASYFTSYENKIFFSASDGINGTELWQTDGTPGGAFLLKDIFPGAESSSPGYFSRVGEELLFKAAAAYKNNNLYRISKKSDNHFYIIKSSSGQVIILPL